MKSELTTLPFEVISTSHDNQTMETKMVAVPFDTSFKKDIKKVFSRADLWNIEKQRKRTFVRRYY